MVAKLFVFLGLAVVAAHGQAVTEIQLPDQTATHLSNPLIGKTIGIAKFWFDTQVLCQIIFPNGSTYVLHPDNKLENEFVTKLTSADPFNGCGVAFLNAPESMSGTYELMSLVDNTLDNTSTLTRQRFHLTFYKSDSWIIPSKE